MREEIKEKERSVNIFPNLTVLAASRAFLLEAYVGVSVCIKYIWSFISSKADVYFFWKEIKV